MLKDLTSENLIRLNIEATDWEDAVRKAAQPLLEAGKVKQSYIDDIIVGAKESGPYFVLAQHVALPHARPEAGALESAIGVATLATPVGRSGRETGRPGVLQNVGSGNRPERGSGLPEQVVSTKQINQGGLDYVQSISLLPCRHGFQYAAQDQS